MCSYRVLAGAQFIQTEKYIQVTGNLDQTALNIAADDPGGEMDPMGADMKGNPVSPTFNDLRVSLTDILARWIDVHYCFLEGQPTSTISLLDQLYGKQPILHQGLHP